MVINDRLILDSLSQHIAVINKNGFILYVNESWKRFGYENECETPGYGLGFDYFSFCEFDVTDGIRSVLDGAIPVFNYEYPCHSPYEKRWFVLSATPIFEGGRIIGATLSHVNITDRRESEELLKTLAFIDELTGIPNRRYAQKALSDAFQKAKHHSDKTYVFLVDCDDFKRVNDTWGHDVGDRVLKEIAKRLKSSIRDGDIVARYGGDEFLIGLPSLTEKDAADVAERILDNFREPIQIQGVFPDMQISIVMLCIQMMDTDYQD